LPLIVGKKGCRSQTVFQMHGPKLYLRLADVCRQPPQEVWVDISFYALMMRRHARTAAAYERFRQTIKYPKLSVA
jgi:hypothetical protein